MVEELEAEFIPLDIEQVMNLGIPKAKFLNGVKDAAYYAGFITTLLNTGINEDNAKEILLATLKIDFLEKSGVV